jgi:hypothetical protein
MWTIGVIREASRAPRRSLLPHLRARLDRALEDDRVRIELPAFSWPWRVAALAVVSVPLLVPDPVRFLAASGLL